MSVNFSLLAGAGWQFFTDDGVPLSGGLLYTYAAGTTTPQTTYTSSNGAIPNTNPIVLNSAGRVPSQVWLTVGSTYKFVLQNSVATQIWSQDNIQSATDVSGPNGSAYVGYLPAGAGAVVTTVQAKLRESISVKDFGATGDGVTNDTAAIQTAIAALTTGQTLIINPGTYIAYGININKSNIIIENYGSFTLPNNVRQSIFKIAESANDVTFRNYGVLNGNKANQGDLNTIPLGTGILEISNDAAAAYTYRTRVENYGEFKDGANNGIYAHRKISDLTVDPAGLFSGHRNDGISSSSTNQRFRVANGIFSQCGAYGQAVIATADYSEVENITVKNIALNDDGVPAPNIGIAIGHSGTPPETGFFTKIMNNTVLDIGDSTIGILLKSGLSDNFIVSGNVIGRTVGVSSGGLGIRCIGGVANSTGGIITNNIIAGPWGAGINVFDASTTGFSPFNILIADNNIDITAAATSTGIEFYSGGGHTITGNIIRANTNGINTQLEDITIVGNSIECAEVGIRVRVGSNNLVCTSNNIIAVSVANAILLEGLIANPTIGMNLLNGSPQSGVPVIATTFGAGVTDQILAAGVLGNTRVITVTLTDNVAGKTGSTYSGGFFIVSNVTDKTHAIYVDAAGTMAILAFSGANWSATYDQAAKEGIAYSGTGDGPILFSNRGAAKTYQVFCFGGA